MEKVARTGVQKQPGFLYFVTKHGHAGRTKMARRGQPKGKQEVIAQAGVKKEAGYLYFVDKQGDISREKLHRAATRLPA